MNTDKEQAALFSTPYPCSFLVISSCCADAATGMTGTDPEIHSLCSEIGPIMVPKMPNKATAAGRVLLVLLLLCAVICAQGASLASEQFHQHASQHCCGL